MRTILVLIFLLLTDLHPAIILAQDPLVVFEFPPEYGEDVETRNPAVGFRADGSLIYAWRSVDWKLWIYDDQGELIRIHNTGYHDIGEKGGVLLPFMFWDLTGDGVSELITRSGRTGTDSTWIQVVAAEAGETLAAIPFPAVYNWDYNQVHYLNVAYLDGQDQTPSIVSQVGVHTDERFTAFDVQVEAGQVKGISQRWEIINTSPTLKGSGGHGIWVFDTDGDGRDEVLAGALTLNHDGTVKWFVGQEGRSDGHNGYSVGHVDYIGIGDLVPSGPGLEAGYCIEGGMATHKAPGAYVARLSDGKILWSDLTGHTDLGWVADITFEHEGLEFGAWSKPKNGVKTFRLYTGTGEKIFEEACESPKYTKPIRWLGNGLAQIMIVRSGSSRDLAEWKDGAWHTIKAGFYNGELLPRRYAKGDIYGDSRDELITINGRMARVHTNTDPPQVQEPGIRELTNYWASVADAGASYTYYPPWLYASAENGDSSWIFLVAPSPGVIWEPGSKPSILWSSSEDFSHVKLEYSTTAGRTWTNIASKTSNDGRRDWTIPTTEGDSCHVKVTSKDDEQVTNTSPIFIIRHKPTTTDTTIIMEKDGVQFKITIELESLVR